jgi:hypothetical protein
VGAEGLPTGCQPSRRGTIASCATSAVATAAADAAVAAGTGNPRLAFGDRPEEGTRVPLTTAAPREYTSAGLRWAPALPPSPRVMSL